MKKETKNIFNQSYQQHESEVDASAIWDAVQPNKKKRRGIIWWLFGSSMLIIGIGAIVFFTGQDNLETSQVESFTGQQTQNANPGTKAIEETIERKNSENQIAKAAQKEIQTSKESLVSKKMEAKRTKDLSKSQLPIVNKKINAQTTIQSTSNKITTSQSITSQVIIGPRTAKPSSTESKDKESNESELADDTLDFQAESYVTSVQKSKIEIQSFDVINRVVLLTKSLMSLDDPRDQMECYLSLSPIEQNNASSKLENEEQEDELNSKNGFGLTLMPMMGLFTDNYTGSNDEYVSLRSETEKPLESFGAEMMFSYQVNRVRIEMGLNYLRSNRIMEWSGTYFGDNEGSFISSYDPFQIDVELINKANYPSDVFLYDRALRKYNETHTLSIPINLVYSYSLNALEIGVFGGASFHLIQKHNVDVLNSDFTIFDQRLNSSKIKLKPDLMTGINLAYELSEHLSLQTRFSYRYRVIEEVQLMRQSNIYSLGMGLHYSW